MLVYSILFTPEGKSPKENMYVQMFHIWVTFLIRNGGLTSSDRIDLLVDKETFAYMKEENITNLLIASKHSIPVKFHLIDTPKTIAEGMCMRYSIRSATDLCIFLDLDILVVSNLHDYWKSIPESNEKDTLFIFPEFATMWKDNYALHVIPESLQKEYPSMKGYTSGWFAYCPGTGIQRFLSDVCKSCNSYKGKKLYTIDQPFFNQQVFVRKAAPVDCKVVDVSSDTLAWNTYFPSAKSPFVNFAGEPGVGSVHLTKMLGFLNYKYRESG
jgi:hypothetical protein